jgi:hypothetical protein
MANKHRKAKHPVITTGLYSHIEKWTLDKRTKIYKALEAARGGLVAMFPQNPSPAACLLIDRILFKGLKLSIYERMEMQGVDTGPGAETRYLAMSNSLREDIRLLTNLTAKEPPEKGVPDLAEYLASLEKVGPKGEDA